MKARIPPDALLVFCGASMWVIAWAFPQFAFPFPYGRWLFWFLLLLGFVLAATANRSLARRRTTSRPGKIALPRAAKLVTTGVYRYSRNPVYLGMVLMLLAWTVFLRNWLSSAGVVIFVLFINTCQILPEERALAEIFGEAYSKYKEKVRRWI